MTTQTNRTQPDVFMQFSPDIMDDCSSGEILRNVVLSLYNGYRYPMPLHRLAALGTLRGNSALILIGEYIRNGETPGLRLAAETILQHYPQEAERCNADLAGLRDLRDAWGCYQACRNNADSETADAQERLIEAVGSLFGQTRI